MDGAPFTSVTVSVMGASVSHLPSLTRTRNGYVPGPCDSLGVHRKTPESAPMLAPGGAPTSENVSTSGGASTSVAVAVNVYAASSGIAAVAGTFESTGGLFSITKLAAIVCAALTLVNV